MIDLETHDTRPTARILSIGAVMFDPREAELGDEFYAVLNFESQEGRTVSQATLDWWDLEGTEAAKALTRQPAEALQSALAKFRMWWDRCGAKYPWSHGATFDIGMLDHAYGYKAPWKFWNVRDTRTMYWLANTKPVRQATHHDALEDAKAQALAVQRAWRLLKETQR